MAIFDRGMFLARVVWDTLVVMFHCNSTILPHVIKHYVSYISSNAHRKTISYLILHKIVKKGISKGEKEQRTGVKAREHCLLALYLFLRHKQKRYAASHAASLNIFR